jgi:hypothetical protein
VISDKRGQQQRMRGVGGDGQEVMARVEGAMTASLVGWWGGGVVGREKVNRHCCDGILTWM